MEVKFFTNNWFLDLSSKKLSFQESNSKLSDKALTKFTFPFEVYIDEDFIRHLGDYSSFESSELSKEIRGYLQFEGKVYEAILDIVSIEGDYLTGQIDFGFDEIPNYDKKLSDLPLEKFAVNDIHTYAVGVCRKQYPATNFNFPRIHTKKYSPTVKMWDAFEGYYNHTIENRGVLEMARNVKPTAANGWNIDNVNIIHPCPHILYLLKLGFEDAGYSLAGDILKDKNLRHRWVFSGTQYFRNRKYHSQVVRQYLNEHYKKDTEVYTITDPSGWNDDRIGFTTNWYYRKRIDLPKRDNYNIDIVFNKKFRYSYASFLLVNITHKGNVLYSGSGSINGDRLNLVIPTTEENGSFDIEVKVRLSMSFAQMGLYDSSELMSVTINSMGGNVDESDVAEETKVVENENYIDLSRAVPNMTFGEFVGIVRNWFNYDLKIVNKTVYMNLIGNEETPRLKDFRDFEINKPKRTLLEDKSFLLKFPDFDGDFKRDSMYYDRSGAVLNGAKSKNTSVIEINGYDMPIGKAKEHHTATAQVKKDADDILALVYYDGLRNGKNDAANPPGCHFPELFINNWEKWLRQRVRGEVFEWKFLTNVAEMSKFSINDILYCYQKRHIIKSMNKDLITPDTYEVEIKTETF